MVSYKWERVDDDEYNLTVTLDDHPVPWTICNLIRKARGWWRAEFVFLPVYDEPVAPNDADLDFAKSRAEEIARNTIRKLYNAFGCE